MGCNCKTKKGADKLIKTMERIDKSKSKSYVSDNKRTMKIAFNTLTVIVYAFFVIMSIIFIIPIIAYMALSGKAITIKPIKFKKNGK